VYVGLIFVLVLEREFGGVGLEYVCIRYKWV
jgi:hypothetical protein